MQIQELTSHILMKSLARFLAWEFQLRLDGSSKTGIYYDFGV